MSRENREFDRQLSKASKNLINNLEDGIVAAATQMFGDIIKRTPVDKGKLVGNWQVSLNRPINDEIDRFTPPTLGHSITTYKITDSIYFTNNVSYAQYVEEGTAYTRPANMVKTTISDFKQYLKNTIGVTVR